MKAQQLDKMKLGEIKPSGNLIETRTEIRKLPKKSFVIFRDVSGTDMVRRAK